MTYLCEDKTIISQLKICGMIYLDIFKKNVEKILFHEQ